MVKHTDKKFIDAVYNDIAEHLENKDFIKLLKKHFSNQDIYHIKENIYNLDFWINKYFLRAIKEQNIQLKNDYADLALMNIFATTRETFFGLLIYLTYLKDETNTKNKEIDTSIFIKLYIQDILHIDEHHYKKFIKIIENIQADFNEIIKHWIQIDDNKDYLKI